MRVIRITSMQWSIGGFCAILGALMLVAPHQFDYPDYEVIRANLFLWGTAFLLIGIGIIITTVFPLNRAIVFGIHLVGSLALGALAEGFRLTGFYLWMINYSVLALALLFAGLLRVWPGRFRYKREIPDIDLFALAMGMILLLSSSIFLAFTNALSDRRYLLVEPYFRWLGLLFLIGSLGLLGSQFVPRRGPRLTRATYWLAALALLAYMVFVPAPNMIWTGILFYGEYSLCLVFLPWMEAYLFRFSPTLLRTRLALLLAVTMAIPLVVAVALMSFQQEQSVKHEILDNLGVEANTLAEGVSHYIGLHQSAVVTLASQPGLMDLPVTIQHQLLQAIVQSYPGATAVALFRADGSQVVRSDNTSAPSIAGYPVFEQARTTLKPSIDILISPIYKRPMFALGAPVLDGRGQFIGLVVMAMDSSNVANYLATQDNLSSFVAYMVDGKGRTIAHPDQQLVQSIADLSQLPPVATLLAGSETRGFLSYGPSFARQLVGYASVPGLGWRVILEQPEQIALAGVYAGRDLAFGILMVFMLLAAAVGSALSGWLVNPLNDLRRAATQVAAGGNPAALPHSRITEIETLITVFEDMRNRLAQRTAEREQAEEALRQANEGLESKVIERTTELEKVNEALASYARQLIRSNQDLQDFAYITSHDLQEPLRKIQAFGERLKIRSKSQMDAESQDYIQRMVNAAHRMQTMINDLLAYSRVTTRAQPLGMIDLNQVAEDVISDLELRIEQTGGRVETQPLPVVFADPLQMHQLLQNLISNALKFHKPDIGPCVKISGQVLPGRVAEIVVEDNGIGFEEKYVDRIFQPFQRLHGRSEYEGSGIGLAICRKIIERHNGSITAQSTPGQGTKFIILLPIREMQDEKV